MQRVVVIGADAAGMSAAHQALRTARARGGELEVVVLDRGLHTSYSACGLPYWIAGVRALKTIDDGAAWIERLDVERPLRAVVVGGGYVGIETAEAFVRRGLATTLVTRREVMSSIDPDMGARVRAGIVAGGVEV